MEADDVYAQLNDKITDLQSKDSEFQGTIDYLQSSLTDIKNSVDKLSGDAQAASDKQRLDDLVDQIAKQNAAIAAAADKEANDSGLINQLNKRMDDATNTLTNLPQTVSQIGMKAWNDGKQELLNTWEQGKKDLFAYYDNGKQALMNSLSAQTTQMIKDAKAEISNEVSTTVKGWFTDEDNAKKSAPVPVNVDELEGKVRDIIAKVQAEQQSELDAKIQELAAKVMSEQDLDTKIREVVASMQQGRTS